MTGVETKDVGECSAEVPSHISDAMRHGCHVSHLDTVRSHMRL